MTRFFAPFLLVVSLGAASDVLSVIKPNRSGAPGERLGVPFDGRFNAMNVTVAALIGAAYGGTVPLDPLRISSLPGWATRDRFDVDARAAMPEFVEDSEDDAAIFAAFAMVRTMLAERFALRVHDDSRVEPIYALVQAARRPAASLKPTARDCEAGAKAGPFVDAPRGSDGVPLPPCGVRVRSGEIVASGGTLAVLAKRLSGLAGVGREVVDKTGDAGRYDFTLHWSPQQTQAEREGGVSDPGPSLFTALQEQLGLRLEPRREPVRVLVVDHVERPTPN